MFNLYQIVAGAQGGQGLEALAGRFGLSREQADGAVRALVPALSAAFMAKSAQPGGLGEIAGAMNDDGHRQAYAAAAPDPDAARKGGDVAGSLFGGAMMGQVIAQASQHSGIPAATLERMLPVITSTVLGGAAAAMHGQGLGPILGQLANGGLFGPFGGGAGQAGTVPGGSFGGMVGAIFGNLFGDQPTPAGAPAQGSPAGGTSGAAPGGAGMPPMMRAGMEALGKMFQSGVRPGPGQGDVGDR